MCHGSPIWTSHVRVKRRCSKAALSVIGQNDVLQRTTFKGIMNLLSKQTLPIGWDDPEKHAEMKEVSVAVFNKKLEGMINDPDYEDVVEKLEEHIDEGQFRRMLCGPEGTRYV
ncbi:hypothetical protein OS493_039168 [Desmophyllum pertusum]|uniref:Uncharacterized protein n=1 Tax=Desmophyllum pertusum TaxID=174260 RepID=A0A9W9YU79_9CNID|nr:hypothetical protein OS493_039168 [Desmophyllum pertusum]